jgi:hypothetical protein
MSDHEPKVSFHPGPSVQHELGVMFGAIAFFVLAVGVYYALWQGQWRTSFGAADGSTISILLYFT